MNAKKKTAAKEKTLVVTLVKRPGTESLRQVTFSMGLRKLNRTRRYPDRPEIRGMIFAVKHLVNVTEEE
jgi:large subunit ribosomal protein L30